MGVLACDREGCENIMCGRLSYQYGYICYECFEELVNEGPQTSIVEFMGIKKDDYDYSASFAYFDAIFKEMQ